LPQLCPSLNSDLLTPPDLRAHWAIAFKRDMANLSAKRRHSFTGASLM
jgi:hypothetical protein